MSKPSAAARMGTEPLNPLLLSLAIPMMISMLVQALYNVVDSIFVSYVNEAALSAVSLAFPIQNLLIAFAVGTAVGVNAHLSKSLGEGNREEAERAAMNGLFLAVCSALGFLLFGLFGAEAFITSQTSDPLIARYGAEYLTICTVFSIGCCLQCMMEKVLVASGHSTYAMITQMVGALTNIVLDPVFIFGFGMGVQGAALATIIAQAVSAVWVMAFLMGKRTKLRLQKRFIRLDFRVLAPVLALGVSPFIMQSTESLVNIAFNASLKTYGGDPAVGAMTICSSIMQVFFLLFQGISQGAQPIIGYNYGSGQLDRVKKAFRLMLLCAFVFSTTVCLSIELLPGLFVAIFNDDPALVEIAIWTLRVYAAGMFMLGIQSACQQTFVALNQAKISLFLALLRKVILLIPLILLLPMVLSDKVLAVFLAEPAADIAASVVTGSVFLWRLPKILAEREAQISRGER